jgi:hypothetical protein
MSRILTELCPDVAALERSLEVDALGDATAVVLLTLGIEPDQSAALAARMPPTSAVYAADCYGILGFSASQGRNVELMEAGRGKEYGGTGGAGGRGVVAVVFRSGFVASTDSPPDEATSHLVVASSGAVTALLTERSILPYYGGVAKQALRFVPDRGSFEKVPQFFVSSLRSGTTAVGVTSFTDDVTAATTELISSMPAGHHAEALALFPCFMRGVNAYGKNNVEPDAISALLPGVRLFGMFCHGELGPSAATGFGMAEARNVPHRMHSMTSIVAVHAATTSSSNS